MQFFLTMMLLISIQNKEKHLHCYTLLEPNLKRINPKNLFKDKVKSAFFLNSQQFLLAMALLILVLNKKNYLHYTHLLKLNLKKINLKNLSKCKSKKYNLYI